MFGSISVTALHGNSGPDPWRSYTVITNSFSKGTRRMSRTYRFLPSRQSDHARGGEALSPFVLMKEPGQEVHQQKCYVQTQLSKIMFLVKTISGLQLSHPN